jgi:energy-coupling factor transport system ATP-binding protein
LLAIVGRNGAGKSTLSKLLVGLLKPGGGRLEMFGQDAFKWNITELSQKIALVFQNPEHQFLTDTVFDEIAYSYISKSGTEVDTDELRQSVQRVLAMLDLADVAQDHPFALSAGKKRRLGVAAMLVGSPEVLVVDEPTYGQDKAMTSSLMDLILQLRKRGITIVMITHNMRLVEEYADRVIVMNQGLTTFDGHPRDLFHRPEIMEQASLKVTTLQTLVNELGNRGKLITTQIRSIDDFLDALGPI